jgi:hypothetical protein
MNFKKIFIFFFLFISIVFIASNSIIFFDIFVDKFKKNFSQNLKVKIKKRIEISIEKNQFYLRNIFVYGLVKLGNKSFKSNSLLEKRDLILQNYILEPKQISYTKNQNIINSIRFINLPGKNSEINCVKFYDVKECGIIEYTQSISSSNNKKLLIYFQGHGSETYKVSKDFYKGQHGNPYNHRDFIKIKNHYLAKGFDILSLSMSNKGYNFELNYFPNIILKYLKKNGYQHEIYKNFYDPEYPNKKPLSLMLSGNFYLINEILTKSDYQEIYAVGISGGGWYSTILSAIIPQITRSFSFSGTIPLPLQYFDKNKGDWELSDRKNYKDFNYFDLYALSTVDEFNKKTRKHHQIYNTYDSCCYRKPYSSLMKNVATKLEDKNFEIIELNRNTHDIDTNFLFSKF